MLSKTIYVDLDDVLSETARGFLALLERDFGRTISFEEITSFELSRSFRLTPEEVERFMHAAHRDEVLAGFQPIEKALPVLHEWRRKGYRIEVVTGRPPSTQAVSERWLQGAGVPHSGLTFLAKYAFSSSDNGGPQPRPLVDLRRDEFCLAIEDSLETARYLADNLGFPVALLDKPWNRTGGEELDGVRRCHGWDEVASAFPNP